MKSMDIMLEQARTTLSKVTSSPQILAILSRRGYGAEELQEGLALYEVARELAQTQGLARYSKVTATQTLQEIWTIVKLQYHQDVRVARVALRRYEGSHYFLQIDGTRMKAFDEWYAQAREFYFGLRNQPELLVAVEKMGLTSERINQGIQNLQTLNNARLQQDSQKGSAISTRRQRDQALAALDHWMSTFRQYARLALAPTPEHLATLGLKPAPHKPHKKNAGIKVELPARDMANLFVGA